MLPLSRWFSLRRCSSRARRRPAAIATEPLEVRLLLSGQNELPFVAFEGPFLAFEGSSNSPPVASAVAVSSYTEAGVTATAGAPATRRVVFDGDSFTQGFGVTNLAFAYPNQAVAALGPGWVGEVPVGLGGQITDLIAKADYVPDAGYDPTLEANVRIIWIGGNDIARGETVGDTYTRIAAYARARRADGYRVVVATITSRKIQPTFDFATPRDQLNALIRNNWTGFADALADVAAVPELSDPTNRTYFFQDGVHFNNTGYGVTAGVFASAVRRAVWSDGTPPPPAVATDPDGDPLTFSVATGPGHGSVRLDPDNGVFTYLPTAGFYGTDRLIVAVNDGQGGETLAPVTVEVVRGMTVNDSVTLGSDELAVLDLLANDFSAAGGLRLTAADLPAGAGAALTVRPDGVLAIDAREFPADSVGDRPNRVRVRYYVTDAAGNRNTGSVIVNVLPRRPVIVSGSAAGSPSRLRVLDPRTGAVITTDPFAAYGTSTAGVRVAVGDFTGDGIADYAAAGGPGGLPVVRLFNGVNGFAINTLRPFGDNWRGGFVLATGDLNGDGRAELLVGKPTGGTDVRAYDALTGTLVRVFRPFPEGVPIGQPGGISIAAADVTGDGRADLVAANTTGRPLVRVLDGATGELVRQFLAFAPSYRDGVNLAAGDVDGDGFADIITGMDQATGPEVNLRSGRTGAVLLAGKPFGAAFWGGVTVAAADVNGDGRPEMLLSGGRRVIGYDGITRRAVWNDGAFARSPGIAGAGVSLAAGGPTAAVPVSVGAAVPLLGGGSSASLPPAGTAAPPLPSAEQFTDALRAATAGLEAAAPGLSAATGDLLRGLTIRIARLPGATIAAWQPGGQFDSGTILLSPTAGGRGWYVSTAAAAYDARGIAIPNGPADGRYDLVTAIAHAAAGALRVPTPTRYAPLAAPVLPPGLRRLLPNRTLNALFGSDPSTWLRS